MIKVIKKFSKLSDKRVLASWVAVVATLLLSAEILWTVEGVWPDLEAWSKAVIIIFTFMVVVILGWRRSPTQRAGGIV